MEIPCVFSSGISGMDLTKRKQRSALEINQLPVGQLESSKKIYVDLRIV